MVKVTLEFPTVEAMTEFFNHPVIMPAKPEDAVRASIVEPPAKRGRKKASEQLPPDVQLMPEPTITVTPVVTPQPIEASEKRANTPVNIPEDRPLSVDDVRSAFRQLFDAKGGKVATDLLKQFGAVRLSDVPPEKLVDFFADCKRLGA